MAYLVYIGTSASHSLSGSQYDPIGGTARLKIKTGTGKDDVLKYGWTTDTSASQYSPIRAVIKDNKTAYIGRATTVQDNCTQKSSTSRETTTSVSVHTRSSQYIVSYETATRSSLVSSTYTTTRVTNTVTETSSSTSSIESSQSTSDTRWGGAVTIYSASSFITYVTNSVYTNTAVLGEYSASVSRVYSTIITNTTAIKRTYTSRSASTRTTVRGNIQGTVVSKTTTSEYTSATITSTRSSFVGTNPLTASTSTSTTVTLTSEKTTHNFNI